MKFFLGILLAAVLLLSPSLFEKSDVQAQSQGELKIGHLNTASLLQIMPGRDSAQLALEQFAMALQNDLMEFQQEFQKKVEEYQRNEADMPRLMKEHRREELIQMEERIRRYQENAQKELQEKEQELLQPLLERAQNAIDQVAEEGGFTYILDTSSGAVVFVSDKGEDILPKVKEKLGLEGVEVPEDPKPTELELISPDVDM